MKRSNAIRARVDASVDIRGIVSKHVRCHGSHCHRQRNEGVLSKSAVRPYACLSVCLSHALSSQEPRLLPRDSATGVNPAGDAGDTSPQYFGWGGRQREYPRQYYYVLSDIADHYWLPYVRSASSRFHSAIRRHQFAPVRQADSRLTRLVPPTLNSR